MDQNKNSEEKNTQNSNLTLTQNRLFLKEENKSTNFCFGSTKSGFVSLFLSHFLVLCTASFSPSLFWPNRMLLYIMGKFGRNQIKNQHQ
jgi:hypothetical protein